MVGGHWLRTNTRLLKKKRKNPKKIALDFLRSSNANKRVCLSVSSLRTANKASRHYYVAFFARYDFDCEQISKNEQLLLYPTFHGLCAFDEIEIEWETKLKQRHKSGINIRFQSSPFFWSKSNAIVYLFLSQSVRRHRPNSISETEKKLKKQEKKKLTLCRSTRVVVTTLSRDVRQITYFIKSFFFSAIDWYLTMSTTLSFA